MRDKAQQEAALGDPATVPDVQADGKRLTRQGHRLGIDAVAVAPAGGNDHLMAQPQLLPGRALTVDDRAQALDDPRHARPVATIVVDTDTLDLNLNPLAPPAGRRLRGDRH